MRVLVLGGTRFLGRRVVERLHDRGDQVLLVHRGRSEPPDWLPVAHLRTDRRQLADHRARISAFDPEAVLDTYALTAGDVETAVASLPSVPTVVLSSQDVYQAFVGLQSGRCEAAVPLDEDSELRRERYPYRGLAVPGVPEDYDKLDVEERWLARGAVALRLPLVYGPHDQQRREDLVLRRVRAGRTRIPIGAGNLLWTRGHVDDLAGGVLAALDSRGADGRALNLGEARTVPVRTWLEQILSAAESAAELVRVPDDHLPQDLAITGAPAQHLLVSSARARQLLGWRPGDPAERVAASVRWHLAHPPREVTWNSSDTGGDDHALARC